MKTMKKLFSIVLVLALVLSLGISAWATPVTPKAKTVNVTIGDKDGLPNTHTYNAYQIFIGTQAKAEDTSPLGDIQWGNGIDYEKFLKALVAIEDTNSPLYGHFQATMTARDVAKALGEIEGSTAAEAFGKLALNYKIEKNAIRIIDTTGSGSATAEVQTGYYVIEDVTEDIGPGEVMNDILVEVVEDLEIAAKNEGPSSHKEVQDVNDSTGDKSDWQETADYDIGDNVPYQLTVVIPSVSAYDEYYVHMIDVLSKGLTYNDDAKITVNDTEVTKGFTSETVSLEDFDGELPSNKSDYTGGTVLTLNCEDFLKLLRDYSITPNVTGYTIVVSYTAKLNESAVIGSGGNPNTFIYEYKRNPNADGHGHTTWDTNIVFTYKGDVSKVDGENKPLDGAGFTLYKYNKETEHWDKIGEEVKPKAVIDDDGNITGYTGEFKKGLDDGQYKIVETTTPPGYNTAEDIEFTIEATHNDKTLALEKLEVKDKEDNLLSGGTESAKFNVDMNTGALSTTVINTEGLQLPETGGIGTTILYVVGGVLVVVAVIFLITKKRMGKAQR